MGDLYILCVILCQKCVISGLRGCQGYVRGVEVGWSKKGTPHLYLPPRRGEEGLWDTSIYYVRHFGTFWDIS